MEKLIEKEEYKELKEKIYKDLEQKERKKNNKK